MALACWSVTPRTMQAPFLRSTRPPGASSRPDLRTPQAPCRFPVNTSTSRKNLPQGFPLEESRGERRILPGQDACHGDMVSASQAPATGVEVWSGKPRPERWQSRRETAGQPRSTGKVRWEPTRLKSRKPAPHLPEAVPRKHHSVTVSVNFLADRGPASRVADPANLRQARPHRLHPRHPQTALTHRNHQENTASSQRATQSRLTSKA